jgi:hypothetical protein
MIFISERKEYPFGSGRDLIAIKCRPISGMATNRLLHHSADISRNGRLGHRRQMLAQERNMSKFATRLLTPATYAAALVVVPAVIPAKATTSISRHTNEKFLALMVARP